MSSEYKTLSSVSVFSGIRFEVRRDTVDIGNGKSTEQDIVQHPGAVVILPLLPRNEGLVLIKQYRHAVGSSIYEFPAGTLEKGESPEKCAHREIAEEVSYGAKQMRSIGCLYPAPGFCNELQHLFVATGLYPESAEGDEDEIIEVEEVSFSEFEKRIADDRVQDAKSIAIYFRAKLLGLVA